LLLDFTLLGFLAQIVKKVSISCWGQDGSLLSRGTLKRTAGIQNLLETGCFNAFLTHFAAQSVAVDCHRVMEIIGGQFVALVPNMIRSPKSTLNNWRTVVS